jgi:hypothetical protein
MVVNPPDHQALLFSRTDVNSISVGRCVAGFLKDIFQLVVGECDNVFALYDRSDMDEKASAFNSVFKFSQYSEAVQVVQASVTEAY